AAIATTCDVKPGIENADEKGALRARGQGFTDIVEAHDPRIAGTNTLLVDITVDPKTGNGSLTGSLVLRSRGVSGAWEGGLLEGEIRQGPVTARGLARGTGARAGQTLRVDFQQLREGRGKPPCDEPKAFFDMRGLILEPT